MPEDPEGTLEDLLDAYDRGTPVEMVNPRDERLKIDADPEEVLRALLATRPTEPGSPWRIDPEPAPGVTIEAQSVHHTNDRAVKV